MQKADKGNIQKADKGNAIVILDKESCIEKMKVNL